MSQTRILVVDDDPRICELIQRALTKPDIAVSVAGSGKEALRVFFDQRPDLVLLDVMMPDMDGFEVLKRIRELSEVPIIFLTVLDTPGAMVHGFELGADDYVTKPFELAVLRARIEAVLRRREPQHSGGRAAGYHDRYLTVDAEQHRVLVNGERVALSPTEYRLLAALVQRPGRLLTYNQLLEQVWGWEYRAQTEYLHVYISRLRRKLEPDPAAPRYLVTEPRAGYRFEPQH